MSSPDLVRDPPLCVPLSELDASSLQAGGGKAKNLGELLRAGLPVPGGFCVTTAAFRLTLRSGALAPILDAIEATGPGDVAQLSALAAEARQTILATALPAALGERITAAYAALGGEPAFGAGRRPVGADSRCAPHGRTRGAPRP